MQYLQKLCNIIKVIFLADYKIMLLPCKVWEDGGGSVVVNIELMELGT